ncbi:MAG TPA: hypothetical protein VMC84_06685 [Methanocella sp.]|uniref:hypothetical protein n=1 Tax=Methanocella sp. TaxID=2052833 RepID=UPI002C7A026B|nr:hypothetical protein [Methanocella sp.]HTY90847.1 hypothetical protein [Methanocella sp.]
MSLKYARLLTVALLLLIVVNAGCVGFIRDAYKEIGPQTPESPVSPTPEPVQINQTIERQYNYADRLNAGLNNYNNAIIVWNQSRKDYDSAYWDNATANIGLAAESMEQARTAFLSMKSFASTDDERALSEKWNETAYYDILAFGYINQSYQEGRYQASRSFAEQNPVRYNYFVSQANYYISLAKESKAEAEALENRTFIGQLGQVITS